MVNLIARLIADTSKSKNSYTNVINLTTGIAASICMYTLFFMLPKASRLIYGRDYRLDTDSHYV
jgi:hypothetical protein